MTMTTAGLDGLAWMDGGFPLLAIGLIILVLFLIPFVYMKFRRFN